MEQFVGYPFYSVLTWVLSLACEVSLKSASMSRGSRLASVVMKGAVTGRAVSHIARTRTSQGQVRSLWSAKERTSFLFSKTCGSQRAGQVRQASAASNDVGAETVFEKSPLYVALEDCEVLRVSDESKVKLTDMWKSDERALVAFARHFG